MAGLPASNNTARKWKTRVSASTLLGKDEYLHCSRKFPVCLLISCTHSSKRERKGRRIHLLQLHPHVIAQATGQTHFGPRSTSGLGSVIDRRVDVATRLSTTHLHTPIVRPRPFSQGFRSSESPGGYPLRAPFATKSKNLIETSREPDSCSATKAFTDTPLVALLHTITATRHSH